MSMRLTITIENKELVIRRSEKSGQTTILHTEIDRARMEEVSALTAKTVGVEVARAILDQAGEG